MVNNNSQHNSSPIPPWSSLHLPKATAETSQTYWPLVGPYICTKCALPDSLLQERGQKLSRLSTFNSFSFGVSYEAWKASTHKWPKSRRNITPWRSPLHPHPVAAQQRSCLDYYWRMRSLWSRLRYAVTVLAELTWHSCRNTRHVGLRPKPKEPNPFTQITVWQLACVSKQRLSSDCSDDIERTKTLLAI